MEHYVFHAFGVAVFSVSDGKRVDHGADTEIKDRGIACYGKNILIVGDSYMYSFWLYYLQESFHNTVYLHFTKQYFLPQVMLIYKPDIVIFENASREFFLNTPNFKELTNYMEGLRDLLKGNK